MRCKKKRWILTDDDCISLDESFGPIAGPNFRCSTNIELHELQHANEGDNSFTKFTYHRGAVVKVKNELEIYFVVVPLR